VLLRYACCALSAFTMFGCCMQVYAQDWLTLAQFGLVLLLMSITALYDMFVKLLSMLPLKLKGSLQTIGVHFTGDLLVDASVCCMWHCDLWEKLSFVKTKLTANCACSWVRCSSSCSNLVLSWSCPMFGCQQKVKAKPCQLCTTRPV